MRGPGQARFGLELDRSSRCGRNADEMMAGGALNLAPGELLIALQVLVAVRAAEFEVAHKFLCGLMVSRF